MSTTILNSFDIFVIISTASSSFTLPLTAIGLIVKPISTRTASGLKFSNEVIHMIAMRKIIKDKKQY